MMSFIIQPYNSKQLAAHFKVGYKMFLSWLTPTLRQKLGPQIARCWNPDQVQKIIEHIGVPEKIINDDN
jgi:hypothetical protein